MSKSLIIIPRIRNPEVIRDYALNAVEYGLDLSKFDFLILTEDFRDKHEFEAVIEAELARAHRSLRVSFLIARCHIVKGKG